MESFVIKLFNTAPDYDAFKSTVRDLLISMKQFASTNDDLYREEKEMAIKQQQEIERKRREAIPGLVTLSQML